MEARMRLREAVEQDNRRTAPPEARKDAPGLRVKPMRGEAGEKIVGHGGVERRLRAAKPA
jgi:hypothetical protein